MKTALTLMIVCAAAFVAVGSAETAQAQDVHLGVGRLHVDVGHPHRAHYGASGYGRYGYVKPKPFTWNTHYRHFSEAYDHGHGRYRSYYRPGVGSHHHWHDTTHYDYHPGGYVPHFNHYHYAPGHYDLHRSGHWDAHY
jgi:hypothetical protein